MPSPAGRGSPAIVPPRAARLAAEQDECVANGLRTLARRPLDCQPAGTIETLW